MLNWTIRFERFKYFKKVLCLNTICDFGDEFTDLYYFFKTFNCWETQWYFECIVGRFSTFLLIEIGLFSIRLHLDHEKKWSTYPLYKRSGLKVLKNDTTWKFWFVYAFSSQQIPSIEHNKRFKSIMISELYIVLNIS